MSNYLPKICPICGKEFFVKPSSFDRRVVCSKACQSKQFKTRLRGAGNPHFKNLKIEKTCEMCGMVFQYYESVRSDPHYCSQSCAAKHRTGSKNAAWKGGYKGYYGGNWIAQKQAVRTRDNHICQMCGITEHELGRDLDVHHIKPFATHGTYEEANQLSNLISLCPKCHRKAERISEKNHGITRNYKSMKPEGGFVSVPDAARMIGLTVQTVYDHIYSGKIKAVNMVGGILNRIYARYKIPVEEVSRFIESRK